MSTTQQNKEVIQNLYDLALNQRKFELLPHYVSEDYIGFRGEKGPQSFKEPVLGLIHSFPNIQWNIQELLAEDDRVMVRWKLTGTQTLRYQYIANTGNKVANDGLAIFVLKNGKVIKGDVHTDRLGFLQQLDVLPQDISLIQKRKPSADHVRFIDKFLIPPSAKKEFMARMAMNRDFIRNLPGFIEDAAYAYYDEQGNAIVITIALWENDDAVQRAKEVVQAEYKRIGFNPGEMMQRLHITMDRGLYKEIAEPVAVH